LLDVSIAKKTYTFPPDPKTIILNTLYLCINFF
jgi:hypothetical protein